MHFSLSTPLCPSFRVDQIAGMFDVPLADKLTATIDCDEPPALTEDWRVGVILGPSGAGKTSVARQLYGEQAFAPQGEWPADRAVIDVLATLLPERSTKDLVRLLGAVGLSSPPAWIKPYRVLSNGERFRCDLARALIAAALPSPSSSAPCPPCLRGESLLVVDEYSSVVDRTTAKTASHALAKAIRSGEFPVRLVAVTCHDDVAAWLAADWTLDLTTGRVDRRGLRRPSVQFIVRQVVQSAWRLFARHHYLSGALSRAATCFGAFWDDALVALSATIGVWGKPGRKRVTRIVVAPEAQGLGLGMRLTESVCAHEAAQGFQIGLRASHPAIIAHCRRSPHWRAVDLQRVGRGTTQRRWGQAIATSANRVTASFDWIATEVRQVHRR